MNKGEMAMKRKVLSVFLCLFFLSSCGDIVEKRGVFGSAYHTTFDYAVSIGDRREDVEKMLGEPENWESKDGSAYFAYIDRTLVVTYEDDYVIDISIYDEAWFCKDGIAVGSSFDSVKKLYGEHNYTFNLIGDAFFAFYYTNELEVLGVDEAMFKISLLIDGDTKVESITISNKKG